MAKVSKKEVYPDDLDISEADYLLGTNANNNKKTQSYPILKIAEFIADYVQENVDGLDQDNIFRFVDLGKTRLVVQTQGSPINNNTLEGLIDIKLENYSLVVTEKQIVIFKLAIPVRLQDQSGNLIVNYIQYRKYYFPLGKGNYSPLSSIILASALEIAYVSESPQILNVELVESDINNVIFDLGDITGQNFLTVINTISNPTYPSGYPLIDSGKIYYFKWIDDSVTYLYFFDEENSLNSYGNYGVDGDFLFQVDELQLFYSSNQTITDLPIEAYNVIIDPTGHIVNPATNLYDYINRNEIHILNARSTGIRFGGYLTDLGGGIVRISAGQGEILNNTDPENPTYNEINWVQTDIDLSLAGEGVQNFIYVGEDGLVVYNTNEPDHEEFRLRIYLQRVVVRSGEVTGYAFIGQPIQQYAAQIWDIKSRLSTGKHDNRDFILSADGLGGIDISAGGYYSKDAPVFNPLSTYETPIIAKNSATFRLALRDNTQSADVTVLDVTNYDNGAGPVAMTNNRWGVYQVFMFVNENIRILRPQTQYTSSQTAIEAVQLGQYSPVIPENLYSALCLGWIIFQKGDSTLSTAVFITSNRDGGIGGSIYSVGASYLFKDISTYPDVSLPLVDTDKLLLNRGGDWFNVNKSDLVAGGGSEVFSFTGTINQSFAGSTSWYSRVTFNATVFSALTTDASLTPVNDFSDHAWQTPCFIVPYDCKIKRVFFRGGVNASSTSVRFVVLKSLDAITVPALKITNAKIIADKTFITNDGISPSSAGFSVEYTGAELDTVTTVLSGSEIRVLLFNNNVASNIFSGVYVIQFEKI